MYVGRSRNPSSHPHRLTPRKGVARIGQLARKRRELQWPERVAHHGQLLGSGGAERLLDEPGLRSVRQPTRVKRQRSYVYPRTRPEVALDVVDDLLGLEVRVVVGQRNRQRIPVELARAEGADHEAGALEGLVRGRRLVQAPGLGLEVMDVERVGVDVAVPAYDVQRVIIQYEALVAATHAHDQLDFSRLSG